MAIDTFVVIVGKRRNGTQGNDADNERARDQCPREGSAVCV